MATRSRCGWAMFGLVAAVSAAPALARPPIPASPTGSPAEWVTPHDYPGAALRAEQQGTTGFVLTIGSDGLVSDCRITLSSGSPELDTRTCELLRARARFTPARDTAGRPITGSYASRVRWVIPQDTGGALAPEPSEAMISWRVGPDGTRSDCRVERASVEGFGKAMQMAFCQPGKFAEGYRDATGTPVARRVRMTMSFEVVPEP